MNNNSTIRTSLGDSITTIGTFLRVNRIVISLFLVCCSCISIVSIINNHNHVVSAYSIIETYKNSNHHSTTSRIIELRRSPPISLLSLPSKESHHNSRNNRYIASPTISKSNRRRRQKYTFLLMNYDSSNEETVTSSADGRSNSSNEPFFAISKSSSVDSSVESSVDPTDSTTDTSESNSKPTTTSTTSSTMQPSNNKSISKKKTVSSSAIDDPVLSMADSFVDVFTSFGKLFTNIFQTINTNTNTNTNTNNDNDNNNNNNNSLQIENEMNEEDVSKSSSTLPPLQQQIVSSTDTNNDNDEMVQSDITSYIDNDDNIHSEDDDDDDVVHIHESTNVDIETIASVDNVDDTDTTNPIVNGVSYENQYTDDNYDEDDDPYHMTTTSNDDISEYYDIVLDSDVSSTGTLLETSETNDYTIPTEEVVPNAVSVASDTVQQNEGWTTTTTTSIDSNDDNDDYGVIVEYDINELDRWKVQSVDSTTNTTNDDDDDNNSNVLLEPISTITIIPSSSDTIDDNDVEEDSNNSLDIDAGLKAAETNSTETTDLTEPTLSESLSDPDDVSEPVLEQIDVPVISDVSSIDEQISIPIVPTVQSDETNTDVIIDAISPILDSFPTTVQDDISTTSIEVDTNNNESNVNDVTATTSLDENDVVMVYDMDELDSWSTSNPNDIVQLDAITMTLTEVESDDNDDDDADEFDIDESNDDKNEEAHSQLTYTDDTEVDDIGSVSIVDDILSDIDNTNAQSITSSKDVDSSYEDNRMVEQKNDIKIDFETIPDLPDDDGSTTAIDEMEWKSAEQLAKSLNQPYEADDNSSDDHDAKGLSKIPSQTVDDEDPTGSRVESRGQLDRESYMQSLNQVYQNPSKEIDQLVDTSKPSSRPERNREMVTQMESLSLKETKFTVDDEIDESASTTGSIDLSDKWNKMTLNELKDELGNYDLPKSGTKAKLIARLLEHAATKTGTSNVVSDPSSSLPSLEVDPSADIARDWTTLKVADLKIELNRRGLPSSGKKAELVAMLVDSDRDRQGNTSTNADIITTSPDVSSKISITDEKKSDDKNIDIVDDEGMENLEELARAAREAVAMFEQTTGNIATIDNDVDELVDVDELFDGDVDIDLNDLDFDIIGKAAREAALQMQAKVDDDEPSDEALWEIENGIDMELDDSIFVSEDVVDDITMITDNDDSSTTVEENEQESGPPPNYSIMAVSQLKEELSRRGLRVTGKKVDLIARLEASDKEIL
jgi:hypothetical protein